MMIEREWLCLVRDAEVKARDKDIAREVGTREREWGVMGWEREVGDGFVVGLNIWSAVVDSRNG